MVEHHDLANLLASAAQLANQHINPEERSKLVVYLERQAGNSKQDPYKLFCEAWRVAGLVGKPTRMDAPTRIDLPFIVYVPGSGWQIATAFNQDGSWGGMRGDGTVSNFLLQHAICLTLPRRTKIAPHAPIAIKQVLKAMWQHKTAFSDSILASVLCNLLALVTALYSLQVFDRVIPNHGFQTLKVLTVGAILAVFLEFTLKILRSRFVDKACSLIDQQLSEWIFNRLLGIRLEVRPASVGTLASQVKGFEMVRGVMTSSSMFVLVDLPFAILFVIIIALVGGWVVIVPLVSLPIILVVGVMFKGIVRKHTDYNHTASNRKAGLLVEAVDGAETLKANSAEQMVLSRWGELISITSNADLNIRNFTTLSQNLTVSLQQISYVALIATGAYLVTIHELTMGGLLACSIIGNRAMSPIIQLPGIVAQWALARVSLEGLQQVVALPNEADGAHEALVPQFLEGSIRIENVRFAYVGTRQIALEVEKLEVKSGESIGLIGPIGSGKSTLLKVASGLYRPNEGKVFLGGADMSLLAPKVAREVIGYLPQETRLFSGTLRDNLVLGLPDPMDDVLLAAAKRTGLIDLIRNHPAGLALELSEGGRGVSGGQKQLIALTRMLIAKPKIWLLDEPTGSMDPISEMRVVSLLREVVDEGATLMITTHKTALLPILDRLMVIQGGRIQIDGSREAVLKHISKS